MGSGPDKRDAACDQLRLGRVAAAASHAAPPPVTLWPRGRDWVFVALVFGLATLAYSPVWHAGFIWDDDSHLTNNVCIVGPLGFSAIWTTGEGYYFPLTTTTLWVIHALFGLNPLPYHLLNVVLHSLNGVLLWRVLRTLAIPGAWLGALVWVLHPVQVESVAWISELKNTQSAVFYLLAIWFYVQWVRGRSEAAGAGLGGVDALAHRNAGRGHPARRGSAGWAGYGLAVMCGLAAILSKSSTVMLPVVLWLAEAWVIRGKARNGVRALLSRLMALVPFAAISALAAAWTIWEQRFHSAAAGADWDLTLAQRLIVAGKDVWFYLGKLVWPYPLIFIYPRWSTAASQWSEYLPVVSVVAVLAVVWRWRSRVPAAWFATAYFAVSLFPVLGFFNVYFFRYSFVGDHFQYLASMGPLAFVGAEVTLLCRRSADKRHSHEVGGTALGRTPFIPAALLTLGVVVAASLAVLTGWQARTYRDNETLFGSVIERNPASAMAHNNLGLELAKSPARQEEAVAHFRAALQLNPTSAEIHYNLANMLRKRPGELTEAIAHYETALRLQPDYAEAHNNLALALQDVPGRLNEAIAHYEAALHYNPENARAHNNLAVVLATIPGRRPEAISHLEAALKLDPAYAAAHRNLADVLAATPNGAAEAIAHYERALALNPDSPEAHFGLANVLQAQSGREADAERHYEEALRLNPRYAPAHNNLGILLARARRFEEAASHWRRAAELAPDYEDPRRNLELLRRRREGGR